jgi:hypothetical protein
MAKKKASAPVAVQGLPFGQAIENMMKEQEAEQARFDALSDEDKAEYIKQRDEDFKKAEELIKELSKDPGFSVFTIGRR